MRRLWFLARDLGRLAYGGIHLHLLFPPQGRQSVWPKMGSDGLIKWPPFHCPVFVLTPTTRRSIETAGGTTFHFLAARPVEALGTAVRAANGKDVRIGGVPTMVRDYLGAGLVARLHVAIAPILLGGGIRLWDDLRGL